MGDKDDSSMEVAVITVDDSNVVVVEPIVRETPIAYSAGVVGLLADSLFSKCIVKFVL